MEGTELYHSFADALRCITKGDAEIASQKQFPGGDINSAWTVTMEDGNSFFVKTNPILDPSFFAVEAHGLSAIAATKSVRTPKVLARGIDHGEWNGRSFSFLILEKITAPRRIREDIWEHFADQLAAMHKADTSEFVTDNGRYGFFENNYIGRTPQINTPKRMWVEFFRDCRLRPLYEMSSSYFSDTDRHRMDFLLEHLDRYLEEPDHPSLVHGDMWSGNVIAGSDGAIWLIDPAVYVGSAEVDLAMSGLFGGYPTAFYREYREAAGLDPGYKDRRDLYNLYHLLNHTLLFGWEYYGEVSRILKHYAG